MSRRTVGVEEELLLVDAQTGAVVAAAPRALDASDETATTDDGEVGPELFQQQIETGTAPCRTAAELRTEILERRRDAMRGAAAAGAALVAVGTPVFDYDDSRVTPKSRYERIAVEFGAIGRQAVVCGMHVHVSVADDEEGVRVIDGLRPWLPVLRAMSANSPFWRGRDTGYASWRSQVWGRFPTAGPAEPFGTADAYRQVTGAMIASGAAIDEGMLYLDARLSRSYPTVEVRVFDVVTDPGDAVLLAMLTRGLVSTIAGSAATPPAAPWRTEALRAAHWLASRDGLSRDLLHPVDATRAPARTAVDALVEYVSPALEGAGDRSEVSGLTEALFARGTGSARQRASFEAGGLAAVMSDLQRRFADSLAG
jgi:carboxylate-amine ligase